VFDLRSFSLDDMYRCSAELRAVGEASRDADDAAGRTVSYLFDQLRLPETNAPECQLVRLFRTRRLASLGEGDAAELVRLSGSEVGPDTLCLSLRASRGVALEWNDPALSRRHRVIPLTCMEAVARMPMVAGLISQLGMPSLAHLSGSPASQRDSERFPLFNVFHVGEARGSPLVPDQKGFVEPYRVESVLGFGGMLPPSELFVVILFANVAIPRATADLFRTIAPSVGLALLSPERDIASLETRIRAYELIVRHHEEVALNHHRQLEQIAGKLAASLAERQQFEALVENSSDFIGMATPDARVVYLNPAARQMVGLSPTFDVTTLRVEDFYAGDDRSRMENEAIPVTIAEGHWADELLLRRFDTGKVVPVSNRQFTVREPETGRVLGIGGVLRDVSAKRREAEERERLLACAEQARAEAMAASRAKDEFLAALGHELRNPLSPILTAVELMKLRGARSREQEVIERQAVHLARLVDDLLDISRIARGKIEVHKRPVEIAAVVAHAVERVSPAFAQRKQQLVVEVPEEGLLVDADPERLSQVVSNLLDNGSKYSASGTEVRLYAERAGEQLRLHVCDHGMGIAPDMLDAIFESFVQQREGAPAAQSSGLGLGLAIARSLVTLHDGWVYARSEGLGKGSEFIVELPLISAAAKLAAPAPSTGAWHPRAAEQTKRVLLVDDNTDAANVLGDALSELGLEVLVASDGPSALEIARQFRPEVALLDIGLPAMDGYELASRLRRLPGMPDDLRLVAVSGYGQESDRRRSLEAGFSAHLVKPVRLEALMEAVGREEAPRAARAPEAQAVQR